MSRSWGRRNGEIGKAGKRKVVKEKQGEIKRDGNGEVDK